MGQKSERSIKDAAHGTTTPYQRCKSVVGVTEAHRPIIQIHG